MKKNILALVLALSLVVGVPAGAVFANHSGDEEEESHATTHEDGTHDDDANDDDANDDHDDDANDDHDDDANDDEDSANDDDANDDSVLMTTAFTGGTVEQMQALITLLTQLIELLKQQKGM